MALFIYNSSWTANFSFLFLNEDVNISIRENETFLLTEVNASGYNNSTTRGRDEELAKIEIALQVVIFVLNLFGNTCVITALGLRPKKLTRMHHFILHLSISDLMVAFFNTLPQIIWDITFRFQGSDFICRFVKFSQIFVLYLSTYILVVTAIDRYQAICQPLTSYSWSPRQAHIMVGAVWIISGFFSIPQIIIFQKREVYPGVNDCWGVFQPEWGKIAYVLWFTISIYMIPLLILMVTYGCISCTIWTNFRLKNADIKSNNTFGNIRPAVTTSKPQKHEGKWGNRTNTSTDTINPRTHSVRGISKAKIKTVKLTFVVVLCYILCWSPFFIAQLWSSFDMYAPITGPAFTIMFLLVSLNSCANPWIYIAFSDNLIKEICQCGCPSKLRSSSNSQMSMSVSSSDSDQRKYSSNKIEVPSTTAITGKSSRNGKFLFTKSFPRNQNPKKKRTFNKPVSSISMENTSGKRNLSIELEETILYSTVDEEQNYAQEKNVSSKSNIGITIYASDEFLNSYKRTDVQHQQKNLHFESYSVV